MKRVKRIAIGSVVVLAVVALILNYGLGMIVKTAVAGAGSPLLGVPISLGNAHLRLFQGKIRLNDFVIGNPDGFKTEHAIRVEEVAVDFDVGSLFGDTFVIHRIYVKAPEIVYEAGLGKSNIGRILGKVEASGEAKPEGAEKVDEAKSGKKVIIEDFLIEDARVRLSASLAMGAAAPIPLPDIHLKDIGKEEGKQGASPAEAVKKVFGAIAKSVTQVLTGAVALIGDGAKELGKGAGHVVGGVKNMIGLGDSAKETNAMENTSHERSTP